MVVCLRILLCDRLDVVATVVSDNRYTPSRVVERLLTDWMSVENRPLLHGTAGNSTTPLQQAQSHPQQILASSQVSSNTQTRVQRQWFLCFLDLH
jgi:hypothetical protein